MNTSDYYRRQQDATLVARIEKQENDLKRLFTGEVTPRELWIEHHIELFGVPDKEKEDMRKVLSNVWDGTIVILPNHLKGWAIRLLELTSDSQVIVS